MKLLMLISVPSMLLFSCAEQQLIEQETLAIRSNSVTIEASLEDLGVHSAKLSRAYRTAAQNAAKQQDIAAAVTILAAATVVTGAVGSASNTAIANRAIVGSGTSIIAGRTVPKTAIQGIYIGAKRMNCVSTTANMGRYLLAGTSPNTKYAARAATFGAIAEVQIVTREALIREVAEFATVRDTFVAAVTKPEVAGLRREGEEGIPDLALLNQYLGLLDNCLAAAASVTAVAPIPKQ
ncbi:MAG: hypothetical protein ACSHXB_12180 [Sulfitobacter sp.]